MHIGRRRFASAGLAYTLGALLPPVGEGHDQGINAADRIVGLSYTNWFNNVPWTNVWGHPKGGYYLSTDTTIIAKHLDMIKRSQIDFILIDLSNELQANWKTRKGDSRSLNRLYATINLLDVLNHIGGLKVALLTGGNPPEVFDDGRLQEHVDVLCELFIENSTYRQLFQPLHGKPLLVVFLGPSTTGQIGKPRGRGFYVPDHWQGPTPGWTDPRFTVRFMGGFLTDQLSMVSGQISRFGYWSWEDRGQPSYAVFNGRPEEMTVVAASEGSSLHRARSRSGGETFLENWRYARKIGPQIALVTTFNEWWRGEQHNPEFSRDIEPSEEFGDLYINMLAEQAKLFKSGL